MNPQERKAARPQTVANNIRWITEAIATTVEELNTIWKDANDKIRSTQEQRIIEMKRELKKFQDEQKTF